MDFKPQTFFIGVIEFFSVLLPGALLTWFFMDKPFVKDHFMAADGFSLPVSEAARVAVFLFISYITGNLVFVFASVLDNLLYNKIRNIIYRKNYDHAYKTATLIKRSYIPEAGYLGLIQLADAKERLENKDKKWYRALGSFFSGLKNRIITALGFRWKEHGKYILNNFKWAQHFLKIKYPEAEADIKRIEADSKFFRSLVIAFLFIAVYYFRHSNPVNAYLMLGLSALSFYRYGDLRYKSTERAYEIIVTVAHLDKQPGGVMPGQESVFKDISSYTASPELTSFLKDSIISITKDLNVKTQLFAIPAHEKFRTAISRDHGSLYCFSGRGLLTPEEKKGEPVYLYKNAIADLRKYNSFTLINSSQEVLVLLAV